MPRYLVGADLHETSPLLERLRSRAAEYDVPHTSVVAAEDRLVVGLKTACLGVGDVVVLDKRGHNALLFDEEVAGLVIDRLRQAQAMRRRRPAERARRGDPRQGRGAVGPARRFDAAAQACYRFAPVRTRSLASS